MSAPTPRTTSELVGAIVSTEDGVDLTPFIAVANQLVTDVCGASNYTDGYLGSKMELIERWLSAHFYTIFDNQLREAKAGTVSVAYQYKIDLGLKCSMYGQQAMLLDTAGNLAALTNTIQTKRKIVINIGWLGQKFPQSNFLFPGADLTVEQ